MATCVNCGARQPDDAAFCDECGAPIRGAQAVAPPAPASVQSRTVVASSVCPTCGAQTSPRDPFCTNCGAALREAAQPAPLPVPELIGATVVAMPAAVLSPQQAPSVMDDSGVPTVPPVEAVRTGVRTGLRTGVGPADPPLVEALTCGQCGALVQPGSAFCDMCGAPIGRGAVRPSIEVPTQITAVGTATAVGAVGTGGQNRTASAAEAVAAEAVGTGVRRRTSAVAPAPDWGPFQPGRTVMAGAPAWEPAAPPSVAPPVTGRLVVQATGAVLPLSPGKLELLIGREDPIGGIYPDVDLTNHGGDEGGVSRKHARLTVQGGQFAVEDLNSVNGTFINGARLAFGEQCLLSDSDQIRVGRVLLVFHVS